MPEKLFTLKLTEREVWFLHESFEAAFTEPESKNDHERSLSVKLDDLLQRSRK